jgi:hypothetical protein
MSIQTSSVRGKGFHVLKRAFCIGVALNPLLWIAVIGLFGIAIS